MFHKRFPHALLALIKVTSEPVVGTEGLDFGPLETWIDVIFISERHEAIALPVRLIADEDTIGFFYARNEGGVGFGLDDIVSGDGAGGLEEG